MFREAARSTLAVIRRLFAPVNPPNFEETEAYKHKLKYYQQFQPVSSANESDRVDYGPVVDWAKALWTAMEHTEKMLDDKADAVVRYLGGGTALLSLGVLFGVKLETSRACLFAFITLASALPAFFCAIQAISFAIAGRNPSESATLPGLDDAIKIAEFYKQKELTEINLWLILHPISELLLQRNGYKAKQVTKAYFYYEYALKLLIIPLLAFMIC